MRAIWVKFTTGRSCKTGDVAGIFNHHALQTKAQAQRGDVVFSGVGQGTHFAFNPSNPKSTRDTNPIHITQCFFGALRGVALITNNPFQLDLGRVSEPTGSDSFTHREIGIRQINIFTHDTDGDVVLGVMHGIK